jgi:alpha-tubulin suppressor-like RCC1 family protein
LGIGRVTAEPVRTFSRVGLESKCVSVGAGRDFTVCCNSTGDVYSWGSPENGQLGNGTEGKSLEKAGKYTFAYRSSPGKVEGFDKLDATCGIVQVACGTNHALVMDVEGRLYTWGFGGYGRLGHGDAKDRFAPEAVAAFCNVPPPPNPNIPAFAQRLVPKLRATKISCGQTCCYAITGEPFFALYFWGITKKSGEATLRPTIFEELQGIKVMDVACGVSSTIVALEDHTIVTWGPSPTYGELGYGEGNPKSSTKPKEVDTLRGIKVRPGCVAAGFASAFVLADVADVESKKVVEASPVLEQEEPVSGKKREAAAPPAKPAGDKKAKKKG